MSEEKRPEFLILLDELLERLEGRENKEGANAATSTPRGSEHATEGDR